MPEETGKMDEFSAQLLKAQLVTGFAQDQTVARQGVMNHQNSAHLMDLAFIRDATEMSIPESYAVQGLSNSQGIRDAMGSNLAHVTPKA